VRDDLPEAGVPRVPQSRPRPERATHASSVSSSGSPGPPPMPFSRNGAAAAAPVHDQVLERGQWSPASLRCAAAAARVGASVHSPHGHQRQQADEAAAKVWILVEAAIDHGEAQQREKSAAARGSCCACSRPPANGRRCEPRRRRCATAAGAAWRTCRGRARAAPRSAPKTRKNHKDYLKVFGGNFSVVGLPDTTHGWVV
jgi:hypothetical protein